MKLNVFVQILQGDISIILTLKEANTSALANTFLNNAF